MEYAFTCNPPKRAETLWKRGIDLSAAGKLLCEPHIDIVDDRKDYREERHIAKGYLNGIPIVIVYTEPEPNHIHVISARKLKKNEERELVKELGLKRTN